MKNKINIKKIIFLFLLLSSVLITQSIEDGYKYYYKKNYAKAIPIFENEIKNSPVLKIEYFETLADCYIELKDYTNSLRVSREGIIVNRFSSKLFFQKGYSLYKLKDTNAAIEAIERSLYLNPQSAYMNNFLGLLYLNDENYRQAEASFLKATIYNPTSVVYIVNLAATYERDRNYIDALKTYKQAASILPSYKGLTNSIIRVKNILDGETNTTKEQVEIDTLKEQQDSSIDNIENNDNDNENNKNENEENTLISVG